MSISILGARVIDPNSGLDQITDLHLDGGRIAAIGAAPAGFSASRTIQADGLIAAPGLVDLDVALREPGYSRKGSIVSETRAAAAEVSSTGLVFGGQHRLVTPPAAAARVSLTREPLRL